MSDHDLLAEVRAGRFREDLYYRLRVIEIVVPPLRQRQDELPHLIEYFVSKYAKRYNRPEPALPASEPVP